MNTKLVKSGISLVDRAWGGLYAGRNYLLIGQRNTGKTFLSFQFIREAAKINESSLYLVSTGRKNIADYGEDLESEAKLYVKQGKLNFLSVIPPAGILTSQSKDKFLSEYFKELRGVVEEYMPKRIVFDELTHFIEFDNLNNLTRTFIETIRFFEKLGITNLFILRDPAAEITQMLVDSLAVSSTGTIFLNKDANPQSDRRFITITPYLGHPEGKFKSEYTLKTHSSISEGNKIIQVSEEFQGIGKNFAEFYNNQNNILSCLN